MKINEIEILSILITKEDIEEYIKEIETTAKESVISSLYQILGLNAVGYILTCNGEIFSYNGNLNIFIKKSRSLEKMFSFFKNKILNKNYKTKSDLLSSIIMN